MSAKSFLLTAMLAGAAMVCRAGQPAGEVVLSLEDGGHGTYRVHGRFTVPASSQAIWNVLADYDKIPNFVPSMRFSKVRERREGGVLLEQVAQGKVLFFSKSVHLLLDVKEEPFRKITFTDVSHRDFSFYSGSWGIEPDGAGFAVTYALESQRNFAAPGFLAKNVLKDNARDLLEEVRSEILRQTRLTARP